MNTIKKSLANGTIGMVIGAMALIPTIAAAAPVSSSLNLLDPASGSVSVGRQQNVRWTSSTYLPSTVKVNLIKKIASNPDRYALVRTIASNTKNDGRATWVPAVTDVGTGLSVEVGCVLSSRACNAGDKTSANLAVINTGAYANSAAAYQAIEQFYNR